MKRLLAQREKRGGGILVMLVLLFLFLAGCTEYERSGYSAIPQNSPAGWELAPYGDLRN